MSETSNSTSPYDRPLTENEKFWIEIIRLTTWDTDPSPTLELTQKLRQVFRTRPPQRRLSR
jgi:hypothetical protein